MQLVVIAPYSIFPVDTGGKKAITEFYQALAKEGVNVTILTEEGTTPVPPFTPKVLGAWKKGKIKYINPFNYFTTKKILQPLEKPYVVLEHPYMGWWAIWLKWFLKIPFIVRSHNIESLRFKSVGKWWWGILWNYEKWVHRQASHNWFITVEDRTYAIEHFGLKPNKCTVITYGTHQANLPLPDEHPNCRKQLLNKYGWKENNVIGLFTGVLDYAPNEEALKIFIEEILPSIVEQNPEFKLLICGKNLPPQLYEKIEMNPNVEYAGFVDDISVYYKGADIFVNPILSGGGIKTKLIDALSYNLTAISTKTGAFGVPSEVTGKKMVVCEDGDWTTFAMSINFAKDSINTPELFYKSFNWHYIAMKAISSIEEKV